MTHNVVCIGQAFLFTRIKNMAIWMGKLFFKEGEDHGD